VQEDRQVLEQPGGEAHEEAEDAARHLRAGEEGQDAGDDPRDDVLEAAPGLGRHDVPGEVDRAGLDPIMSLIVQRLTSKVVAWTPLPLCLGTRD
jgi:hypothetical protein